MNLEKQFIFNVEHPEHETVRVSAPDRLHAIVEAAHAWGIVKWTEVARECRTILAGEVQKPSQALRASSPRGGAKDTRKRASSNRGNKRGYAGAPGRGAGSKGGSRK